MYSLVPVGLAHDYPTACERYRKVYERFVGVASCGDRRATASLDGNDREAVGLGRCERCGDIVTLVGVMKHDAASLGQELASCLVVEGWLVASVIAVDEHEISVSGRDLGYCAW